MCLSSTMLFAQDLHYQISGSGCDPQQTTITGVFMIDNVELYNGEGMHDAGGGSLEIGVFDQDGVCRGAKFPTWRSKSNQWVYQLQLRGTAGMTYPTFKVYDHATETELDLVIDFADRIGEFFPGETVITWGSGKSYGKLSNMFPINFTHAGGYTLHIDGYADNDNPDGGYYLIASPVQGAVPGEIAGMTEGEFDLYWFNQSVEYQWINYEAAEFSLESGKGYLYAHNTDVDLVFTGTPVEDEEFTVALVKDEAATYFSGWNLVGNPFAEDDAYITKPFYTMNETGDDYVSNDAGVAIPPMTGIFVVAEEGEDALVFTKTGSKKMNLALNLVSNSSVVDRAIVAFGEGRQLPKFQMRSSSTKLYIPMDGEDYAVVSSAEMGEMPVNFKAEKSGSYTLAVSTEVSFNYLHLIDNKTGVDVDLLATPSYSFEAETTDYASRFRLVFATGDSDDTFAFYSNGSFVISNEGEAVVQVMDVTGRMLSSEAISGSASINVDGAAGVYMIRLVNGESVKVQKVVVK